LRRYRRDCCVAQTTEADVSRLYEKMRWALGALALSTLLVGGCATESTAASTCRVHAECQSGICLDDGSCAPTSDAATDAGQQPDYGNGTAADGKASANDGGKTFNDGSGSSQVDAGPSFVCKPDHNNAIERDEVAFAPGVAGTFRVALGTTFKSEGVKQTDGTRVWDLAGKLAGDADVTIKTESVGGRWFSTTFPKATYAARLTTSSDLLGVFRATDAELQLLGVVSPDDGLFATRLTYDPPIPVMKFPLTPDANWTVKSTVSGKAQGVIALYTETYASNVDARGAVKTPFGNFPVLRINTHLLRTVGLLNTDVRSHFFVAECYGTVATIRSVDGTKNAEFSSAAEIRRWAPAP